MLVCQTWVHHERRLLLKSSWHFHLRTVWGGDAMMSTMVGGWKGKQYMEVMLNLFCLYVNRDGWWGLWEEEDGVPGWDDHPGETVHWLEGAVSSFPSKHSLHLLLSDQSQQCTSYWSWTLTKLCARASKIHCIWLLGILGTLDLFQSGGGQPYFPYSCKNRWSSGINVHQLLANFL